MTSRLPELAECLPANVQVDGELIAWDESGNPDGEPTLRLPYVERHALLEEILFEGPPARLEVVASFEVGPALWDAVVARGLEGSSQSGRTSRARLWVKTKNRATERFREELAGARRRRSEH